MTLSVDAVEFVWIAINLTAASVTLYALIDALRARRVVKELNGKAREIVALNTVHRESTRLLVQLLLLSVVVPSLSSDRATPLTLPVVALIAVSVVLLVNTFINLHDRRVLIDLAAAEVLADRNASIARLKAAAAEALDARDVADEVLGERNQTIATLEAVVEAREGDIAGTVDAIEDTHEKVVDIHDKMNGGGNKP